MGVRHVREFVVGEVLGRKQRNEKRNEKEKKNEEWALKEVYGEVQIVLLLKGFLR